MWRRLAIAFLLTILTTSAFAEERWRATYASRGDDLIGNGRSRSFTQARESISISFSSRSLFVTVAQGGFSALTICVEAPPNRQIGPVTARNIGRFSGSGPNDWGMGVSTSSTCIPCTTSRPDRQVRIGRFLTDGANNVTALDISVTDRCLSAGPGSVFTANVTYQNLPEGTSGGGSGSGGGTGGGGTGTGSGGGGIGTGGGSGTGSGTGSGGGGSTPGTGGPTEPLFDVTLSLPTDVTEDEPLVLPNGGSLNIPITVDTSEAFDEGVTLTAEPIEFGPTVTFNPAVILRPGRGSSILTVSADSFVFPGDYRINVTATGRGVSSTQSFLVSVFCDPPIILGTDQPVHQTVNRGGVANLSVNSVGTGPFQYQWYSGHSGNTNFPLAGGTGRTFQTSALNDTTHYWVRVSNGCGSVDSQTATVSVIGGASGPGRNGR